MLSRRVGRKPKMRRRLPLYDPMDSPGEVFLIGNLQSQVIRTVILHLQIIIAVLLVSLIFRIYGNMFYMRYMLV